MMPPPLVDDYPTCAETYAILRMYHATNSPKDITNLLNIAPSKAWENLENKSTSSGWLHSSDEFVESYDAEKHISYITQILYGKEELISKAIQDGWRTDICCVWRSHQGHGGPTLSPKLCASIVKIGIELWFDFYDASGFSKPKDA